MNSRTLIILLVLVSAVLAGFEAVSAHYGKMSPMDQAFIAITSPFERLLLSLEGHANDFIGSGSLREENDALNTELSVLNKRLSRLEATATENEQLRELLRLAQELPGKSIAAEVVSREPSSWFQMVTIDRGESDGVNLNEGVVGVGGAVGKISEVGAHFSRVMLLMDPRLAVPVEILPSGSQGILYGSGAGECVVKYLPHDALIKRGDRVVTSGYGHLFDRGIPVGTVLSIAPDLKALFKPVTVKPSVSFATLGEVLIVAR